MILSGRDLRILSRRDASTTSPPTSYSSQQQEEEEVQEHYITCNITLAYMLGVGGATSGATNEATSQRGKEEACVCAGPRNSEACVCARPHTSYLSKLPVYLSAFLSVSVCRHKCICVQT